MGEETDGDQNDTAMSVARGLPQFSPGVALQLLLQSECLSDLVKLDVYKLVILVALGMNVCENFLGLLVSTL